MRKICCSFPFKNQFNLLSLNCFIRAASTFYSGSHVLSSYVYPDHFTKKKVVSLSLFFHSKTFLQSTLIWDFFLKIGENLRSVWIVSTLTFSILSSTSSMVCCVNTSYKSIYIQHMSCYSKERKTNFYFKGREKWRNIRKPQCM